MLTDTRQANTQQYSDNGGQAAQPEYRRCSRLPGARVLPGGVISLPDGEGQLSRVRHAVEEGINSPDPWTSRHYSAAAIFLDAFAAGDVPEVVDQKYIKGLTAAFYAEHCSD